MSAFLLWFFHSGLAGAAIADDSSLTIARTPGRVTGKVVYTSDPARPWRFGRYYVNGSSTGQLAEAVVALRGRSLKPDPGRRAVTHVMDQFNFQFVPETLAITVRDAVTFTNSDSTTHNVRTDSTIASFNVSMEAGGKYTHMFPRAGRLQQPAAIGCVFHGGMRAWIFVFDHPWYQVTGVDGAFELAGIPPGEYTLEMMHPAGRLSWKRPVVIRSAETIDVEIRVTPDDIIK